MEKYDVIVIGGGSAGLTVASGAASLGARVALIEQSGRLGGDCLHFGCVPSKAFIQAAKEVSTARRAASLGLDVSGTVDLSAVKTRVEEAVGSIQQQDDPKRFTEMGGDIYFGRAEFVTPNALLIEGEDYVYGKSIVIATGSSPLIPEIPGLEDVTYHTNESVFDLEKLPEKAIFIGGGPISLELAQAFSHLGSEVTVVEKASSILSKEDRSIQEAAIEVLGEDLRIVTDADIQKVTKDGDGLTLHCTVEGKDLHINGDMLFVGTGRKPNSGALNVGKAGVETDQKGFIPAGDDLRTNVSHIFSIGDANGRYFFTHAAGMEGKQVVQNAVFGLKGKVSYDQLPWVTYTSPEIFHAGMTEEEATESGINYKVYETTLDDVDRFVADHQTHGLVKILTDWKGKILGAHAVGEGAGDWMQPVLYAMAKNNGIGSLSNMTYPYPNHAAAVQQTADLFWREKLFDGPVPAVTKKLIEYKR